MSSKAQKEINSAIEMFEVAHVPCDDASKAFNGEQAYRRVTARNVVVLKTRYSDYQPGPVKIYTREEIENYVKSKALS